MINITIRRATLKDAEAVYELICELENVEYSKQALTDLFHLNLVETHIGYFVAEVNDHVLGFASAYLNRLLHHCGTVAEIQELIVAPMVRNHQIGQQLLDHVFKWSKQHGASQVEVTCNNLRIDAQRFYQSSGFLPTHQKLVYSF